MNRKLRSFTRGLSIHELRRMALGEELIQFCDREEPILRGMYSGVRDQIQTLITENVQGLLRLQIATADDGESERDFEERRNKAEIRAHERTANLVSMLKDMDKLIDRMSAGGGAAVWAGMQRGMVRRQEQEQSEERAVKPRRRFQLSEAQQSGADHAQPVEAEIVADPFD